MAIRAWRQWIALIAAGFAVDTLAQPIFKCVDHDSTAYQSTPCSPGATETRLVALARAPANDANDATFPDARPDPLPLSSGGSPAPAVSERLPGQKVGPWTHKGLAPGISDDEVLNMPGWGRPSQIKRSRGSRGWREEWTYTHAPGEPQLHFLNGKLVDVLEQGIVRVAEAKPR
jgi:hypothetical protein